MSLRHRAVTVLGVLVLGAHASAAEPASMTASAEPAAPTADSEFAVAGQAWSTSEVSGAYAPRDDNTLAGVYELALRNDPVLQAAEATYRAGRENKWIGLSGLLPQINGTYALNDVEQESRGGFAVGGTVVRNDTDSTVDSDEWSLRLEQPLFDMSAWFDFKRGSKLSDQAQATFSQAQQDLIVRVVNAYADILRAAANLSASRVLEQALAAQLEQVQQRFEVGLVAITDVLDAEAAHDTAIATRVADAAALDVALEILSVITGQQHAAVWGLTDAFPVVDPTPDALDDWIDFALANNVDLVVSRIGRDATLAAARSAASDHLPRLSLNLSRTSGNSDIDQFDLSNGTTTPFTRDQETDVIGLNVTMPIFTGGRLSAQRRQAYAQYDTSARNYETTRRRVTQATRALYINVKRDVAQTRARARSIASTRSALEAAQVGYEVGTRNVVDVLIAQRQVFSAMRDHDNSIVDFIQDVVALKRQAGILTPADIIELDRFLAPPPAPTASARAGDTP